MNDKEFRAFLDLMMCSDPWPIQDGDVSEAILIEFADKEANNRGYENWIDAYYSFEIGWCKAVNRDKP